MKIAVIGASGYIGRNLVARLLNETKHTVTALSPHAEAMQLEHSRLSKSNVDIFDTDKLSKLLADAEIAYYLVHMMAHKNSDFADAETRAATSLSNAIKGTGIKRIIYLGGLGDDSDELSKHLASRHHTGQVLRKSGVQVIEFRASMIIGHGSISYDIVTNLVHKVPVLTLPKWAKTMTQPIGLEDAISYLVAAINIESDEHEIIEIGGPERVSYADLMKRYAAWRDRRRLFVSFHIIPAPIAAWWLNIFTPSTHAKVGRIMVDSLSNPMVVTNDRAHELFPDIITKRLEGTFV